MDQTSMTTKSRKTGRWAAVSLAVTVVSLWASAALSGDDVAVDLGRTRTALEQITANRRLISQERRDLALIREMLDARITLMDGEIASVRRKIDDARQSIEQARGKQTEMLDESRTLKEASDTLTERVAALENRTRALLERLPAPLADRVKPLSQRIPDDPGETKLTVGERFQHVIGILDLVNKFNGEITVTNELRQRSNETSVEVTAVYIGIGYAFYASADRGVAGYGAPSSEGWVWTEANDAAAQIAQAIAILNNEQPASFVQLPVTIH